MEHAERGITNMLNAIQAGIINASTKQRLDELEDAKQRIELQIIQEEMKHPLLSREDVTLLDLPVPHFRCDAAGGTEAADRRLCKRSYDFR